MNMIDKTKCEVKAVDMVDEMRDDALTLACEVGLKN